MEKSSNSCKPRSHYPNTITNPCPNYNKVNEISILLRLDQNIYYVAILVVYNTKTMDLTKASSIRGITQNN